MDDELLFAIRTVSGLFIDLLPALLPLQPPESPGILATVTDHLLQERAGGLQVQQGGQVQVGKEQGDHRRGDDAGQQTNLGDKISTQYKNIIHSLGLFFLQPLSQSWKNKNTTCNTTHRFQ